VRAREIGLVGVRAGEGARSTLLKGLATGLLVCGAGMGGEGRSWTIICGETLEVPTIRGDWRLTVSSVGSRILLVLGCGVSVYFWDFEAGSLVLGVNFSVLEAEAIFLMLVIMLDTKEVVVFSV